MRKGVLEAFHEAKGGSVQILIAPTGYGKSSSVHYAWKELSELWGRIVHILPLRAIVSDAASKAVQRGVPLEDVSYQAAIEEVRARGELRVRKSPYMFSKYVVATYDSFSFSFYVAPVAELTRVHAHRDVGLLAAAGGGVLFDEAHLVLATDEAQAGEEARKVFTVMCHMIEVLSRYLSRPLVIASATLPALQIKNLVSNLIDVDVKLHLCLGKRGLAYYGCQGLRAEEHGLDPDYRDLYVKYNYCVRTVLSKDAIISDVLKALDGYPRVAVFCNTVSRAVQVYRELKNRVEVPIILLHGRLTEAEKVRRVEFVDQLLKERRRVVVVCTQVLEAGVDFDFDAVITEAAAPGALIQRAGRAFRHLDKRDFDERGLIVVNMSEESLASATAVYPDVAVNGALEVLSSKVGGGCFFDWRFAENKNSFIDLLSAIEEAPNLDFGVYTKLYDLLWIRVLGEHIPRILEDLDSWVEGSLVRDSAVLPLFTDYGLVMVSLDYLRRKGSKVLELKDEKVKVIFDIGEQYVSFEKLCRKPLTTLYYLKRSMERDAEFYGFKVREDAYDPEVGLV